MPVLALPFGSVIDVPAMRILGRDEATAGPAEALTAAEARALLSVYTTGQVDSLLSGKANTSHTHTPADITGFGEAVDDEVATLLAAGTGISLFYDDNANTLTIASTVTPGVGGSTGSVGNAVLRANGTGGATLQASSIVIPNNFTSSPNATVNHASIQATGATTNVSVSIVPKGDGAFCLAVPDGTTTGGNVRGAQAVDLQLNRGNAANVASGDRSFLVGYEGKAAGSASSVIGGRYSETNASYAIAGGEYCRANGEASFAICSDSVASAAYSVATGKASLANRYGQRSHSSSSFASGGDCQAGEIVLRGTTTTNAAVRLRPDGSSQRLTIASGQVCQFLLIVTGVRNGGADVATYMRQITVKNIGGTTSIVGTVNTIGTDNAAGTSLSVTADDTNDDLAVEPTGVSGQTWRWQCVVYGGELRHG